MSEQESGWASTLGLNGGDPPTEVGDVEEFLRQEVRATFLCTFVCYAVTSEAYGPLIELLQEQKYIEFEKLAKRSRKDDATWAWPFPMVDYRWQEAAWKPKNRFTRYRLWNDKENQWKYIVRKTREALDNLPKLNRVGRHGSTPFHIKITVRVGIYDSERAKAFSDAIRPAVKDKYLSRWIYTMSQDRLDLAEANGMPVGTRSEEGLTSNTGSQLAVNVHSVASLEQRDKGSLARHLELVDAENCLPGSRGSGNSISGLTSRSSPQRSKEQTNVKECGHAEEENDD